MQPGTPATAGSREAMRPLADWPLDARRRIQGVFTDIDDTLTTAGALTEDSRGALVALAAAGIPVLPITGRAVGWCEQRIGLWPVRAMGAEGGAVLLLPPEAGSAEPAPRRLYLHDEATRARHREILQATQRDVLARVPGVQIAPGAEGRETDIAFDHHEFADLGEAQLAQVRAVLEQAGLTVAVSSIHIHGCVEPHDKFKGACWMLRTLHGRDLTAELDRWVFVGDSANDEAMFRAFGANAIGVANVCESAATLRHWPRHVTHGGRGAGFAEVASALLAAR